MTNHMYVCSCTTHFFPTTKQFLVYSCTTSIHVRPATSKICFDSPSVQLKFTRTVLYVEKSNLICGYIYACELLCTLSIDHITSIIMYANDFVYRRKTYCVLYNKNKDLCYYTLLRRSVLLRAEVEEDGE